MRTSDAADLARALVGKPVLCLADLETLLGLAGTPAAPIVYAYADTVRRETVGEGVLLRGIVEFSNHCRNTCAYCGLNGNNGCLTRYRMDSREIIDAAGEAVSCGIRTVVLQSGEDDALDVAWLAGVIRLIKGYFEVAVTLSLGERTEEEYRLWRDAGADRYLLKIETTDERLYASLHSGRGLATRLDALAALRRFGYQTGSGIMVGLPGQTPASIARDIAFLADAGLDMISIGPFIPHDATPLGRAAAGSVDLTLMALALTRIAARNVHMPATTSLGIAAGDRRADALRAGANVIMPNFTPAPYRTLYEIYPGKCSAGEVARGRVACAAAVAAAAGRRLDFGRGDGCARREAARV